MPVKRNLVKFSAKKKANGASIIVKGETVRLAKAKVDDDYPTGIRVKLISTLTGKSSWEDSSVLGTINKTNE